MFKGLEDKVSGFEVRTEDGDLEKKGTFKNININVKEAKPEIFLENDMGTEKINAMPTEDYKRIKGLYMVHPTYFNSRRFQGDGPLTKELKNKQAGQVRNATMRRSYPEEKKSIEFAIPYRDTFGVDAISFLQEGYDSFYKLF